MSPFVTASARSAPRILARAVARHSLELLPTEDTMKVIPLSALVLIGLAPLLGAQTAADTAAIRATALDYIDGGTPTTPPGWSGRCTPGWPNGWCGPTQRGRVT